MSAEKIIEQIKKDTEIKVREILKDAEMQAKIILENAKKEDKSLHLLGIVSHYSSHGSIDHLFALLKMAKKIGVRRVFIHALIGRRGEKPESGSIYVDKVVKMCEKLELGKVVTIIGRFWALDREENWDRIEKTYLAFVYGKGTHVVSQ